MQRYRTVLTRSCIFALCLGLLSLGGCGDDDRDTGSEGGPCFSNGTCDVGLTCLSNTCVDAGPCTPQETDTCSCPDGSAGVRTCDPAGNWGACGCLPHCGDGTCDEATESGQTCPQDCEASVCGNGVLEADEVCDGEEVSTLTCEDYDYDGGELGCAADCGPDFSGCVTCGDGRCDMAETPSSCAQDCPTRSEVDLLMVVDNSGSMAEEQALLQAQFTAVVEALRDPNLGLPDLHLGVTSTDLGTGMFQITYCEDLGGDGGTLLTGTCAHPTGAPYIIDLAPTGCTITRDGTGMCTSDDCQQANCAEGTLVADPVSGCPRCRNFDSETLTDTFACIANLGTLGCGFEQPLEAMYKALDSSNTANAGFLRNDSVMAVMFLTDEDDCSTSNPQLFDNTQTDVDSTLGPLTSYRCFEFGVTCDEDDRTHTGRRENCRPRDDADALLHPISRYVDRLHALRDPGQVVVAALAGPVDDHGVTVGRDEFDQPKVEFSCTSGQNWGAVPGVRLQAFVEAVTPTGQLSAVYHSICDSTYAPSLEAFAQQLRSRLR